MRSLPTERLSGPAKARLALEVVSAYPGARLALRAGDIRAALATLRDARLASAYEPGRSSELQGALRLGRAVHRTARFVPGDSRCLIRSLVLSHLLARRGVPSTLVIGVLPGAELLAHAWVEREGVELLPSGDFQRLTEL